MQDVMMRLKDWGCNVDEALERMAGDREFFLSLLEDLLKESLFSKLGEDLHRGDVRGAFEKAHTLKGVLGNFSLQPMYTEICQIVEILRSGTLEGAAAHYERLMKLYGELPALLHPKAADCYNQSSYTEIC